MVRPERDSGSALWITRQSTRRWADYLRARRRTVRCVRGFRLPSGMGTYSRSHRCFRMLGLGPARSGAWVGRDSPQVTTGWGFRAEIPARAVSEIGPDGAAVGGWASTAGVGGDSLSQGSSSGLVRLEIEPEVQALGCGHTCAAANAAAEPRCL
jgi:hypothetical protein